MEKKAAIQQPEEEIIPMPEIKVVEVDAPKPEKRVAPVKDTRPLDEKLFAYLDARRNMSPVTINDFLRSVVPVEVGIGQPSWAKQEFSKQVKITLDKMIAEKKIYVQSNNHQRLGKAFYNGTAPETQYYHIGNLPIYVEIL